MYLRRYDGDLSRSRQDSVGSIGGDFAPSAAKGELVKERTEERN